MSTGRATPPPSYESVTGLDDSVPSTLYHQLTYSQKQQQQQHLNQLSYQSPPPSYHAVTAPTRPGYNGQQHAHLQQQQGNEQEQHGMTQQQGHYHDYEQHKLAQLIENTLQQHENPQQSNHLQQERISEKQPVITTALITNSESPETLTAQKQSLSK